MNEIDDVIDLYWVDFDGNEKPQGEIMPLSDTVRNSFAGHAFRARWSKNKDIIVAEFIMPIGKREVIEYIQNCEDIGTNLRVTARDAEFASLSHDPGAPCQGASKDWSCIKYLTAADLSLRNKNEYGLQPNETLRESNAYRTVDDSYIRQIPNIPSVSNSPGYHKMSFTQPMRDILIDWYFLRRNDSMHKHDVIPGGYTNNHKVAIDKIDLDKFPKIHSALVREMRQILEWWTGLKLKHTSTFGVRIYRRDSVLINHVDRCDTHIASAVIQIHQEADEGWPLELYLPNGKVAEVYLQPQELVLYEGAWLRHGRPMRFKGNEFANIFSHFAPPDWRGPNTPNAAHLYNGVPKHRLTTLADSPGIHHSNYHDQFLDSKNKPQIYTSEELSSPSQPPKVPKKKEQRPNKFNPFSSLFGGSRQNQDL
eukprot:CAMPEP_0197317340 /NCGR_PEP_ID=MMETSP0891-20130614/46584_1 /TAXON_ID=44058 ORGANISM="Aureoumbra lagunensis, Strain CCMP1510" /NCGR_SAMPLE_ID=MMETSP0891 /ASSEMBLY_ACC=CAM_ASM_000534 /LENGTH=422 /DNA_ID=CAMNT_0042807285 /DNA_START=197 /DNA_END=1465 /DNA_ORIENTATION=-